MLRQIVLTMLRQIVLLIFVNLVLYSQNVYVRTPIQWMYTMDYKVMLDAETDEDNCVTLYFHDGSSFVIPLPKVVGTRLVDPEIALTEYGINLVTKRSRTTPIPDKNEPWTVLQFYSISYSDIRNGKIEWELTRPSIPAPNFNCSLVPLNENRFLACLPSPYMGGIPSLNSAEETHDWVICGLNENNKFVEYGRGDWMESEGSYLTTGTKQGTLFYRDSKFGGLTTPAFNKIVHTKNYLTIVNTMTGRMLIFSKEKGKLVRRLKLTDAVPIEQDFGKLVCMMPIIIVQPDMDDGIVVLARKEFDIAESIGVFERYHKLQRQDKPVKETEYKDEFGRTFYKSSPPASRQFLDEFLSKHVGVEWYRVNLENGNVKKIHPLDVPDTWDDSVYRKPPYFIPFEYGQILFGGVQKGFQELIGAVFKKSAEKAKPENPVRVEVP